jgi:type I restriction enzyme M protein
MFYNTGIATYIWVLSKNKRVERKGKIQLIDASSFCHKLRKGLGNKKNEITPEDRSIITKLYSNFEENEYCQIHNNTEFMYREYSIMQPLQRSYAITRERIDTMISSGALSILYDEAKVNELENMDELTGKDKAKLDNYQKNKPIFDIIVEALNNNISNDVYKNPESFTLVIEKLLSNVMEDSKELKKIVDKVVKGLSIMDKTADIQKDKKGNTLYDTDTKDVEIVPYDVSIDDYMVKEVLPHIPDAKYFFEEDLSKKTPTIKTGAEIPFTRYFYKYEAPVSSDELKKELMELASIENNQLKMIFGGK